MIRSGAKKENKGVHGKDAESAAAAAESVVEVHRRLAEWMKEGVTLGAIDTFVGKQLDDLGCTSCFLKYRAGSLPPFPSFACLSVNECVVHGTAGYYEEPMKAGDLLSVDIGVRHKGWIGDAAWTYSFGTPSEEVGRLMEAGKESLKRGVRELRPGNVLLEWARVVQGSVEEEYGFHLVRGLGGHGYGRKLHGPPFVSNVVPSWQGEWPDATRECEAGLLVAVEPMLAVGTGQTVSKGRTWPVFTADGSMSVHYEHDVLVTEDGPRVLTAGLEDLPDVIG